LTEPVNLWSAYQQIPLDQRICPVCEKPIEKNLAIHDGILFHWGCLKNDERFGETRALCLDCGSHLSRSMISKVWYQDENKAETICGNSGSPRLHWLTRRGPWKPTIYSDPHLTLLNALESAGIRCLSEYPLSFTGADEQDPKGCRMDIYIAHGSLCIEVDDPQLHDRERDQQRDQMLLREFQIKTVRFTTEEIRRNLAECLAQVKASVAEEFGMEVSENGKHVPL